MNLHRMKMKIVVYLQSVHHISDMGHLVQERSGVLVSDWLLNTMSKYHDQAGLQYHVIRDVSVVTGHHYHCLLPLYPLTHVLFILSPVHLPGLQCLQSWWPSPLMCILHQFIDNVYWTSGLLQQVDDPLTYHKSISITSTDL